MMHVMYNIAFTATEVASKILIFLKGNYLNYQVIANLLNQVISKDVKVSNYVITYLNAALDSTVRYEILCSS